MATKKYQAGGGYTNTTPGEIAKPPMKKGGTTKKYEVGGATGSDSCKPPGCRKKFKSKGKSQETKGGILGTLGAIAGGLGGYAAYKKLKEQKNGGATKYQKGGSLPPMQVPTSGKNLPKMPKPGEERTPKEKRQDKRQLKSALKYYKKHGSGYIPPSEGTKATYKTGGVVNPNAKVSAVKSAGSKGVKSGVNTKASASKSATRYTGGKSTAPRAAAPRKGKSC
jgi:hypothetical protein